MWSGSATVDRRQTFSPFCQIFRLRPFQMPRNHCPSPGHKACIHVSIRILVLSYFFLVFEWGWRSFVDLPHPRRSQQCLAHRGQQWSISRHGEFRPSGIPHVYNVRVLFLGRRINNHGGFAPMTHGKAFEDIMIDLGTRGSVPGAVIAVLLSSTVSHMRNPNNTDDVYYYLSSALGRSIHPPAICTHRK